MYLNKVYLVRYEDLMEKPKDMLGDMMEYIGLPQIQYQDCFFPLLSELRPLCRENTLRKLESILGRVVVLETKEGSEKSMIKEVVKERDENGDCLFGLLLGNGKRVQITLKKEKRRLIGINIDNTVIKEITHQNSQTSLRIAAPIPVNLNHVYFKNIDTLLADRPRCAWDQDLFKKQRLDLERRVNVFGYSLYQVDQITQPKWQLNQHGGLLDSQKRHALYVG